MTPWGSALFVLGGGIILGVIEYHLVERYLVPMICNYLSRQQKQGTEKTPHEGTRYLNPSRETSRKVYPAAAGTQKG